MKAEAETTGRSTIRKQHERNFSLQHRLQRVLLDCLFNLGEKTRGGGTLAALVTLGWGGHMVQFYQVGKKQDIQ